MRLDNTVDERIREIAEFICTIADIPGSIYGSDTKIINNRSTNCKAYNKAKMKVCILHF